MATTDPLIRWETEALRESAARRGAPAEPGMEPVRSRKRDAWVTLRDAHYETGLPVETLRKWARRNHVPSEVRSTEYGERRVVDLVAVERRAVQLGRLLQPVPYELRDDHAASSDTANVDDTSGGPLSPSTVTRTVVDLHNLEDDTEGAQLGDGASTDLDSTGIAEGTSEPQPVAAEFEPSVAEPASADGNDTRPDPTEGAPAGTMIVPIAAWDRMLMQLGNLHEAGQQLADARERAAKAETEATFLRERLAELRRETRPPEPNRPQSPVTAEQDRPETMLRYVLRGWRDRRR